MDGNMWGKLIHGIAPFRIQPMKVDAVVVKKKKKVKRKRKES